MEAKHIKDIQQAYASVYSAQEEVEQLDEVSYSAKAARAGKDIGKPGKAFEKIAKEAGKRYGSEERGKKVAGAVLAKLRKEEAESVDEAIDPKGAKRQDAAKDKKKIDVFAYDRKIGRKNIPPAPKNEEVETDVFDAILEHLVAEGYADTNQAALAIMANMSEEWKQSILDEEAPKRIAIEPSSPRLMPNAGPARVHDPKKIKKVVRK